MGHGIKGNPYHSEPRTLWSLPELLETLPKLSNGINYCLF